MKTDPIFLVSHDVYSKVLADWPLRSHLDTPHGPDHWMRVAANTEMLLLGEVADDRLRSTVRPSLRLFALFHDSKRETDGWCEEHGIHGAVALASLAAVLTADEFTRLQIEEAAAACHHHTVLDPRINEVQHVPLVTRICLDADRLDLTRLGILPDPHLLFTETGRRIARSIRTARKGGAL